MPAWVIDVDSVYSRTQYVAATGFGRDRMTAEGNALAALISFFGQTVHVERTAVSFYQQAIVNGIMDGWIDTAEMRSNIRTTAIADNLMGVEIKEVWFDSVDTYYAVAVMEKARAVQIYSDLIQANLNIIDNLTIMTTDEINSMEGVIRYRFAAVVADINAYYRNIVLLSGGVVPDAIFDGDYYRLLALNVIRTIPVNITVTNDRNGRIFGAFAKSFTDWGFEAADAQTDIANYRYALNAYVTLSPVTLPGNPNFFSRVELAVTLVDTRENRVLLPYNFNNREGHLSQTEADNRAIAAAERNINAEFAALLSGYLSNLLPKR
jgi:hypothetical protein